MGGGVEGAWGAKNRSLGIYRPRYRKHCKIKIFNFWPKLKGTVSVILSDFDRWRMIKSSVFIYITNQINVYSTMWLKNYKIIIVCLTYKMFRYYAIAKPLVYHDTMTGNILVKLFRWTGFIVCIPSFTFFGPIEWEFLQFFFFKRRTRTLSVPYPNRAFFVQ